jgi:hypothetical protein
MVWNNSPNLTDAWKSLQPRLVELADNLGKLKPQDVPGIVAEQANHHNLREDEHAELLFFAGTFFHGMVLERMKERGIAPGPSKAWWKIEVPDTL